MANSSVAIDEPAGGSIDKRVDTSAISVGGQTVERQRIVIADDTEDVGVAHVSNAEPGLTDYGLHVRIIGTQAEDSAHATSDPLFPGAGVRNDTLAALAGTDGDYAPFQMNAAGALYVQEGSAIAITWDGTAPPIGAGTEAAALRVTLATDSTGVVSVDDGGGNISVDWGGTVPPIGAGTEAAALRVTIATDSTGVVSIDDNGGSLTVDNAGTFAVQIDGDALTALQLIDDAIYTDDTSTHATGTSKGIGIMAAATPTDGSVGANDIGMVAMSLDRRLHTDTQLVGQDADISVDWSGTAPPIGAGTEAAALRVTIATDSTGLVSIDDGGGSLTVDGTVSISGAVTVDLGTNNDVQGDVAHDSADSGNPLKVGYKAIAHGSNPTAVAANDRTDAYANRHGIPWVIGGHPNITTREYRATGAQTDDAIVTVAASNKIVVTAIEALADNANSNDTGVRIGFGTANVPSEPADGATVDGILLSHKGIAAGSGVVRGTGAGILGTGGDNEDLRITNEDPGGELKVLVSFYTIES